MVVGRKMGYMKIRAIKNGKETRKTKLERTTKTARIAMKLTPAELKSEAKEAEKDQKEDEKKEQEQKQEQEQGLSPWQQYWKVTMIMRIGVLSVITCLSVFLHCREILYAATIWFVLSNIIVNELRAFNVKRTMRILRLYFLQPYHRCHPCR